MNKSNNIYFLGGLLFLSIIFSYICSEDTLGGAKYDYYFHEKFIILFAEDFINTFSNYGQGELYARNSPVFYIFLSFIHKTGISLDFIRYLNFISIPLMIYTFYNCLKTKFKNFNNSILIIFSFVIFLSPTIRSLVVWPYPILYGFILFLYSIKFYLKFDQEKKNKLNSAFKNVVFLALASYLTPNFSVFVIFFLYKFFLEFKKTKSFLYILILNLLLALPALLYYFANDFYLIKYSVADVNLGLRLNIFNKIIIISSLIFFYFIPFVDKKIVYKTLDIFKNINQHYILIIFSLICIYLFNFPSNIGGGIFFHLSKVITGNNYLLYLIFILSIFLFKAAKLINIHNVLLFVCFILYNLQVSIYHKYFDPLLLFVLLFCISNNLIKNQKSLIEVIKKYYLLYIAFLGMSFYKVIFL